MSGNLLVRADKEMSLEAFVELLSGPIGCSQWSQGDSDSYVQGRYVESLCLGLIVKVCIADESDLPDYNFRVRLEVEKSLGANTRSKDFFDVLTDVVARIIAFDGHEVVWPLNYGQPNSPWVAYKLNQDTSAIGGERIVVQKR